MPQLALHHQRHFLASSTFFLYALQFHVLIGFGMHRKYVCFKT